MTFFTMFLDLENVVKKLTKHYLVPERKLGFFVKIKPPAPLLSEA